MGRPNKTEGKTLSNSERQAMFKERMLKAGFVRQTVWARREKADAGAIARERLIRYLDETLKDAWDTSSWEFYTFLLDKAVKHHIDTSGYGSLEYQKDRNEARKRNNRK
jgi:hypothetical protein